MDPERALRKLEPLMPEQARRWAQARRVGDTETRALVDRQILHTAMQVLGDLNHTVLLSLPPEKRAKGTYALGTIVYGSRRREFGLTSGELLQNTGIFGRSGSGKTNLVFLLLKQLAAHNVNFLMWDFKRTGRALLEHLNKKVRVYTPGRNIAPLPFNPFMPPPNLEMEAYIPLVVDVLGDAYTLGNGARNVLERGIWDPFEASGNPPSLQEVISTIQEIPDRPRVREWKTTTLRALESLQFARIGHGTVSQEKMVKELLQGSSFVELDVLSHAARTVLSSLVSLWIYHLKMGHGTREKLSFVIVVEEAHWLLQARKGSRESVMEMLLRQCRELGIGMIVVDQTPHLISPAALGNTYSSIFLSLKDPRDARLAAGICGLDDAERKYFGMLKTGEAVIKLGNRWPRPILVEIPLVPIRKGVVANGDLRSEVRSISPRSGPKRSISHETEGVRGIRFREGGLVDGELAFLRDVLEHPMDGVKARYQRLGLSAHTGTKIWRQLRDDGWLDSQRIPMNTTRRVALRLTNAAMTRLRVTGDHPGGRESVEHGYWKSWWADALSRRGYDVRLELPLSDGRVDVFGKRGEQRVGIEIETGKSAVSQNVRACLRSELDKVVVVATSRSARKVVERSLRREGLLIPSRVIVVEATGQRDHCALLDHLGAAGTTDSDAGSAPLRE